MGCCGGIVGKVFNPVVDAAKDVGGGLIDAVKDVGSFVDDAVNDIIPGGWATVAAVATLNPELAGLDAATAATLDAAATDAALETASTEALAGWGGADLATTEAVQNAIAADVAGAANTAGAAAEATGSFGLKPNVGFNFGELNPNIYNGSITANAVPSPYPLTEGMAGLSAEQVANANALGQIGTNAASGLGYLGGAAALPSGTAGITGVTSGGLSASDLLKLAKAGKSLLTPQQQYQISSPDGAKLAALVRSGNPFNFAPVTQIQDTKKEITPVYLGQLANLLKG